MTTTARRELIVRLRVYAEGMPAVSHLAQDLAAAADELEVLSNEINSI